MHSKHKANYFSDECKLQKAEILMLLLVLFLIGWASYAIGNTVHKKLVKAGNSNANALRALIVVGSFVIILASIFFLLVYNMSFER